MSQTPVEKGNKLFNLISGYLYEGERRKFTGWLGILGSCIAIAMSLYQIWSVLWGALDPIQHESIHLTFILVLSFLIYSYSKRVSAKNPTVMDVIFMILAVVAGIYFSIHAERIATRAPMFDPLTATDVFFGVVFLVLSFEAARRTLGSPITFVVLAFLAYTFWGQYIGGMFWHRALSFTEIIDQISYSLNGIWGSPIAVSSTFVFMFILFGAFLQESGAGDFFFEISNSIAGRSKGGASKVAVIASCFFGTISGSPTANVVTTGAFTIPMGKRLGYSGAFAGAVEAVASTGGSIMPPIMGSSAFLMAEIAGIPYIDICIAAAIPAILYYASLMMMVHLEAMKKDLPALPKEQVPSFWKTLKRGWHYLIPLVVLTVFLLLGRSPSLTAVYGIISLIIVSWFRKDTRMDLKKIIRALDGGARTAIPVSTACAAAGMVIAGIMSTGLGGKLTSIILGTTSGMLLPTLVLVALICLVLGMGMPVAAAYVLTAMLAVPALMSMNVSLIGAHLFVVYFSIISAITPPVAVAAYAAAGIADANPNQVGFTAVKLGLAAFIVPFMFIYQPALLFDGPIVEVLWAMVSALIGVSALAAGVIGWVLRRATFPERIVLAASGLCLIYPGLLTDLIGFGSIAAVLVFQGILNHPSLLKFKKQAH